MPDGGNPSVCLLPLICSTIAFLIGTFSSAKFMDSFIGWLVISTPMLFAALLGYAGEDMPATIAIANLKLFAWFSPLVLGPLSTIAGAGYTRNPRVSMTLWLVPTVLVVAAIFIASIVIN